MIAPPIDAVAAVLLVPIVAAGLLAALPVYRLSAQLNVLASFLTLIAALLLFAARPEPGQFLLVDDLNVVFIALNALVGFTTSLFSASYIAHEIEIGRLTPTSLRFYHAMYQVMMFGMNLALVANNIGLMWVAIELATLTTVMMVGIYRTPEALEAAWKYFILGSVGIALALFGTILVYMAARPVVGEGLDGMTWTVLIRRVGAFDPALLNVAFVFLLLGYGTKVGLAPLHAWLPDAHAEGPTPISAVLSGLLLNVALYALLRFKILLAASPGAIAPGPLMVTMGLTSLTFAAFMLYRRRDIKRMFAYSSIEHMGIIAFAFGMGGPLANFAGLLHMTMHSLTKSAIFFSVGHIAQIKGTQKLADIRGLTVTHPALGWGLVLGVVAITGMPPLGIFLSEFLDLRPAAASGDPAGIGPAGGVRRVVPAIGRPGLRRAGGQCGARPCLLCADVRAPHAGAHRRHLSAGAARRLVPARGEAAGMTALTDLTRTGQRVENHAPWPRVILERESWRRAVAGLEHGDWSLLGLWGEAGAVHMALLDETAGEIGIVTLDCPEGSFPSVGRLHPPAIRLERTIRDLFGLESEDSPDDRPWLDHGRWGVRHPLGAGTPDQAAGDSYRFLPAEGENLHQIPVGPVHAGIIEPGHFRFTASGETIVRLEARLGYVHKGIEGLMAGADLAKAARLAGRTSGDSTVAYGLAFARAAEAALGIEPPPRAVWLRALMGELERVANHLGDIGAICNDASFAIMLAQCAVLRERVLRTADACFGHRLMRDRIVPGGLAQDLADGGAERLRALLAELRRAFPPLIALYDNTASLQDRTVGTGRLTGDLARRFACGGYVGRASGRGFDARRIPGYAPYGDLDFEVPVLSQGDVNARVWIRIREVEQSASLIEQILARLPAGSVRIDPASGSARAGEGAALVEGFRGDILVWLRVADGRVGRCHLRDPSWFQWPLLEAVIDGNIVADFPLCNKSFNCSYSGHDL